MLEALCGEGSGAELVDELVVGVVVPVVLDLRVGEEVVYEVAPEPSLVSFYRGDGVGGVTGRRGGCSCCGGGL